MYSYEDRIKAVELYIKYDLCAADTVRELGYPNRKMLVRWYKEYQETGDLHKNSLSILHIHQIRCKLLLITIWSMVAVLHGR